MAEKTADDIIKQIKDEEVEYVDIRFCDLPGIVQHFSIPASVFDESVFEDGLAFDGSSVRGFQSIHESDMMLLPDPETARIDPFRAAKTLNLNFFVHDPFTREAYSRDPRNVVRIVLSREPGEAAYESAAATYRGLLAEGVLAEDPEPALSLLEQSFENAGVSLRRVGVLARFRADAGVPRLQDRGLAGRPGRQARKAEKGN